MYTQDELRMSSTPSKGFSLIEQIPSYTNNNTLNHLLDFHLYLLHEIFVQHKFEVTIGRNHYKGYVHIGRYYICPLFVYLCPLLLYMPPHIW